jgi:uncharacterized RDD family membrane protein YckC
MTAPASGPGVLPVPGIFRRLASMLYEGVLLFGVVMIAGFLYANVTQQRHALVGTHGLQAFLFVVLGVYFAWFWSHGGQTVAMKTWQIRVVRHDGRPLSLGRAAVRYLASWLWFLPGLAVAGLSGLRGGWPISAVLLANVGVYAVLARLHPSRQFLHDLLCGTRLVRTVPVGRP